MPLLNLAAATAFLVAACGSSSPSSPTAADAGVEFKVMTFNIQHGLSGAGQYGLQLAINTIAKVKPDLVGVQELTRNHPTYNCEDQPAKIAEGLRAATGQQWNAYYQQEWTTTIRDCPNSGRGDGPETEGIGFFAPEPIASPVFTQLWNGRVGLMTTLPRGRGVPAVVTHLAHGEEGLSDRLRQLDALVPWTLSRPGTTARLLFGDFNLWPDGQEYDKITASYRDAWKDAVAGGMARGRMDGITHKTVRIDYIFYVAGDTLQLKSVENVDTKALIGVDASDHNPLVATFLTK
jgi:endonuclease/exonuclease/phosphatase family metal-dependent hydrolase